MRNRWGQDFPKREPHYRPLVADLAGGAAREQSDRAAAVRQKSLMRCQASGAPDQGVSNYIDNRWSIKHSSTTHCQTMSSAFTHLDPLSRLSLLVFRAQRALGVEGDLLTAPWGLTSAKWKVLGAVDLASKPVSSAAIGRAMGLSRQAALKQTDQLLAMGLLTQQVNPNDTRAPVYSLSPAGQLAYDGISTEWRKRGATLVNNIAPFALEDACQVLMTLLAQMESEGQPQVSEQAIDTTQAL